MGHVLTIESDEAFALATQLAASTGESLEAAVAGALQHPRPVLDLGWLYDEETGLPIW